MSGHQDDFQCCCTPSCRRESFIGRETVWTGWHKRPPPRDPFDIRDKCALRCAVDPEKKKEAPAKPLKKHVSGTCQEPPYPEDFHPQLRVLKKQLDEKREAVTDADLKFAHTAVGLVGKHRESMLDNRLLHRHQVGIPLRCCRDIPCEDFRYGITREKSWKVSHALSAWAGTGLQEPARQSIKKAPKRLCCTDMLALNRAALNAGVTTAHEYRDYRNTHSVTFSKYARKGGERLPPIEVDKNAVYGKKSNYVSSMPELLSDKELQEWQQCVRSCIRERKVIEKQSKPDPWKENTACLLRTTHNVKGPQSESLWHMPRFERKAKPHLCTFRSETALAAAHKGNQLEMAGREGIYPGGIMRKAETTCDKVYPQKD
ncbi:cilia- and flagella-associated protein 77 [Plakobranchus ocellatus]|uniref:Cilia- and flagella-associated protein 77 n=1 Tax=Plakobranchus ocellatus TaxID=259542 RepID=A0AAV3ZEU1_9GAST|nr:cilia- and flagella-associated protein 77 [Plakobranchus ocellatus]